MSDENLYYSKSKGKYIKIAEMPDQHVRRAFLIMNKQNGLSISGNLNVRLKGIREELDTLIDDIEKDSNARETD
jgi:hypothetical protein